MAMIDPLSPSPTNGREAKKDSPHPVIPAKAGIQRHVIPAKEKTEQPGEQANRNNLHDKIKNALKTLLPPEVEYGVGVSGGRDSVVLLHLCKTLRPERLHAIHVHHGLSPHADEWADFCATLCREWQIPLTITRVTVPRAAKEGLEAAARSARYEAFRASGLSWLLLAHHRRDQAETLLFNLCRGAGVRGAAAMPTQCDRNGMTLLRPLLAASAEEIADYARAMELDWKEDESNADEGFSRNFLRHQILPKLAGRFPGVETAFSRAAGHFAEAEGLLAERAAEDDLLIRDRLSLLLTLSPARQANWLRHRLIRQQWHVPESAALTEALRQLTAQSGVRETHFELRLPEGALRLWRGRLHFVPHSVKTQEMKSPRVWDGATPCPWAGGRLRFLAVTGEGISASRLQGKTLELRLRQGGERITPAVNRPQRPLKKLLQEARIPPWQRERLPLVFCEQEFIACPGVAVAAEWQCPERMPGWLPVWEDDAESWDDK